MAHKLREAVGKRDSECILVNSATTIDANGSTSHVDLKNFVPGHNALATPKGKVGEVLILIHIAINNVKRHIINMFHNVNTDFLQKYLDELCYKFNLRYFSEALFNCILIACMNKNEFRCVCG